MTYEQALNYIHSFEKFGMVLGLERIRMLLERLHNPQDQLKFIHIAGTNGKGSTAAMCTRILTRAGYRCGMYTSPFVVDFRERFQIDGTMIGKQEFADYAQRVKAEIDALKEQGVQITEFEAITALAFLWFYEKRCDVVCLEVGLGGNYDATNVIRTPMAAVLCSISLDHVHILGDTVEQIAREKAGVIKQGGVCVCYPKQDLDAVAVFLEKCAQENATFVQANPNAVEILECGIAGNRFVYEGQEYTTKLVGEHQIFNAVNVIEVMKQVRAQGFDIPQDCVEEGIAETSFPARFEVLHRAPAVVVDGAHNLEGAAALAKTLDGFSGGKIVAIMGMLADKDYAHSVAQIAGRAAHLICVPVDNPRALGCEELAKCAAGYCERVEFVHDQREAFRQAYAELNAEDLLIVCGSFFMAGPMREIVLEELGTEKL